MATHIRILGWLHIIFGALGLLAALAVFGGTMLGGVLSGSLKAMIGMGVIGGFAAAFLAVLAIPGLIAGYGLLKFRPWARILTILIGLFDLIHFPFGTALGVYTLWVLLSEDGAAQFRGARFDF